ncbi:large conductance mechanosensitive channel protein MscL [Xylanimonas oleitrophica]|uniref:Large-conductance mechanosensitive channel n=1 Tax=Xylanimonas oleitrophica TaxID=2607479 RepID=A0A2W5XUZ2_9MICO|nr:large conductance mechanosensitive channel protein MscL [Xylanimonas oleitrophica]PZR54198.1 large conductance mechanosensitive channel protein MscL [Xylanimonas oleitrophica]
MRSVLNGFKEFVLRGNAIDLAVGVVVGAAFTTLVTSLVDNFLNPLIGAIFGQPDFSSVWQWEIRGAYEGIDGEMVEPSVIAFGAILTAVINLLIVAAALYFFVVLPINRLSNLRKSGEEPEPEAPAEDVLLLQEIRDLLAAQSGRSTPNSPPSGPQA